MKYHLGEVVIIRKDLRPDELYGNVLFIEDMKKFLGFQARIDGFNSEDRYLLNIDNHTYYWSEEMFEPTYSLKNFENQLLEKEKISPNIEKLCNLIGALLYTGAEEFTIKYSGVKISCNIEALGDDKSE